MLPLELCHWYLLWYLKQQRQKRTKLPTSMRVTNLEVCTIASYSSITQVLLRDSFQRCPNVFFFSARHGRECITCLLPVVVNQGLRRTKAIFCIFISSRKSAAARCSDLPWATMKQKMPPAEASDVTQCWVHVDFKMFQI